MKWVLYFISNVTLCLLLATHSIDASIFPVNPEMDEYVNRTDFFVVFSILGIEIETIRRQNIRMYFDEQDISLFLRLSGTTVSFIPDRKFRNRPDIYGKHSITLVILDTKNEKLAESSVDFTIIEGKESERLKEREEKGEQKTERKKVINSGTISTDHRYQSVTDSGFYIGSINAYGNGYLNKWFYNHNLTLTSDINEHAQSMQRFRVTTGYTKHLKFTLGDIVPCYHNYILKNQRVRGIELNLSSKKEKVNFDFIWGNLKRSVDPYIPEYNQQLLDSAVDYRASQGDSLGHNDSTSYIYAGTYRRGLMASRLHFGSGKKLKIGLTFMKARDDTSSIDQTYITSEKGSGDIQCSIKGDTPKDNIGVGLDMLANFWDRRLQFFTNGALGLITDNTLPGAVSLDDYIEDMDIPLDLDDIAPLLIVNESTRPLPSGKGVANSSAFDVGLKLSLPINNVRERFEVKYLFLGYNYKTLGYESLMGDKKGIGIKEELGLFDNRIVARADFGYFEDNVGDFEKGTVGTIQFGASINFYWDPRFPQVNLAFNNNTDKDKGENTLTIYRGNNLFISSINYSRDIGITENTLVFSFNNNMYNDKSSILSEELSIVNNGFNIGINTKYKDKPFNSRIGYKHSISGGDYETKIMSPYVGFTYYFIPERLYTSIDITEQHMIKNLNGEDDSSDQGNMMLTAYYNIASNHSLYFNSDYTVNTGKDDKDDYGFRLNYEFRY